MPLEAEYSASLGADSASLGTIQYSAVSNLFYSAVSNPKTYRNGRYAAVARWVLKRIFSVLKRLFGETRSQTLADMVEGSLLLNFNNAKRRSEKEAGF